MSAKPARKWDPFRVLFVCTGNICRSPLAEALGRAFLAERMGTKASSLVHLESAGIRAVVGSAMHPDSALVLAGLGGDPDGFRSRQFEPEMAAADLVLIMTREQRRLLLERAPKALTRTFTVREAADLAERVADEMPGRTFHERARALVTALAGARSGRHGSDADDVPDPIGQDVEVHAEVGEIIAGALLPLLTRIAALTRAVQGKAPAA